MSKGMQVMAEAAFNKNAWSAWRTVTDGFRTPVTDDNAQSLRKAAIGEIVELFGGKVDASKVEQRLNNLRSAGNGGLPPIPQGQRGKQSDPAAIKAEQDAHVAELEAAGFKVERDDKGNVTAIIPPAAE